MLFETKLCKVLKLRYKLSLIAMASVVFFLVLLQTNSFLSNNVPIASKVLVVEGWLPDYALKQAIEIFRREHYKMIITTGGPLGVGSYLKEYKDYANLAKATLLALGMKDEEVFAVSAADVKRDRTYHSALALKEWISINKSRVEAFNLASLGPHTRRSSLLFQKAFSDEDGLLENSIEIGSFAIEPEDYNPQKWYASSAGVRTTINELIAYMYVVLLK